MKYQVCRPLTPIEFEALKADIAENGVLVPVEVDENGDILDGHHRVQAWRELRDEGVTVPQYAKLIRQGLTEEQKRNHARKLNVLRRQMTDEERADMVSEMENMSVRSIANATGIPKSTVQRIRAGVPNGTGDTVTGLDGKTYPAQQQPRQEPPISLFIPGNESLDPVAAEATVKVVRQERREEIRNERVERIYPLTAANHAVSTDPDYDGDEWYTPTEYIEAARIVMGQIDLDPASCEAAQRIVQAAAYLTKEDDALRDDIEWRGRVWLNPPYSTPLIRYFVSKLIQQYEIGNVTEAIIITNNSSDTGWFHDLLSRYPACFTRGRAQFWRPDSAAFGARQGQTIFYLGDDFEAFRFVFDAFGQVVRKA